MGWLLVLFVLEQISLRGATTLPLRHFEADIIPLAITQDREGLLWIATPGSLLRFDGLHFDAISAQAEIDLSHTTHLATAPDGSIWIGTESGLIEYRGGRFTRRLAGGVRALAVTRRGRVMATATPREDLYVFMEPAEKPGQYLRAQEVHVNGNFTEAANGTIWFGCRIAICAWSDADLTALATGTPWEKLPRKHVAELDGPSIEPYHWSDVVAAQDHSIWGSKDVAVLQLKEEMDGLRIVSRSELPSQTFAGARPRFLVDRRGRLWIPNRKLQVTADDSLRTFPGPDAPLEDVTAVFEDRQGTLWFGLAGKGLAALPDDGVLETYSAAEGIPGSILDLIRHPRLRLLAAGDSGAYVFDESRNRWHRAGPPADGAALRSVAAGPDGALLSAPYGGGLFISEPPFRTGRPVGLPAGLQPKQIRRLFADGKGAVWLGTFAGLFRLRAGERIDPVTLPAGGSHATDMVAGAAGTLWVGYEGGIARCSADGRHQLIGPQDGMLDPKVRTIAPAESEIWVCYRESGRGFSRFSRRGGRWSATHFRPADGYWPPDTDFLRRDSRGWIWRGTEEGVYVCDGEHTAPEDWLHLTFGDRVNSSNANIYAFREEADGSVWVGTQAGVAHVRPQPDWFGAAAPRVAPVGERGAEIHLSYPGISPLRSRIFRYRLLPLDKDWRVTSTGTLRYPKLRPGAYRLQVASGRGAPAVEYAFRGELSSFSAGPRLVRVGIGLSLMVGLMTVLVRKWHVARGVNIAMRYWDQKRTFMDEMDVSDPEEPAGEDWSGQRLDGFFLLQEHIAKGGFADVYRAADISPMTTRPWP